MHLGDVVDQFHDQNRLAHAGAAEEADLAALGIGRQQVHDLDPGHQDLGFGGLLVELRGDLMDRPGFLGVDRAALVYRFADDVDDPAQGRVAHRHRDRTVHVGHFLATHETFGRVHGDAAHGVFAQVLRHFQNQSLSVVVGFQRIEDRGQMVIEMHVTNGADDLRDFAFSLGHVSRLRSFTALPRRK